MTLSERLLEYVQACFSAIWIESSEHDDALREIAQMCCDQDWRLATFDIDRGLQIPGSEQPADAGGNDPLAPIRAIKPLAGPDSSALLVLAHFHRFLQSAEIVQALASQITTGKQNRTFIVVLSPIVEIPKQLHKAIEEAEYNDELQKALKQFEEELKRQLADVEKQLKDKGKQSQKPGKPD